MESEFTSPYKPMSALPHSWFFTLVDHAHLSIVLLDCTIFGVKYDGFTFLRKPFLDSRRLLAGGDEIWSESLVPSVISIISHICTIF